MQNISIAVIGLGARGRSLAKDLLASQRYRVDCLVDCDAKNLNGALCFLGKDIKTYTSLDTALTKGDFDAICVATPDNAHAQVAVPCFEAGKHVLCEKPLEITIEDCDRILDAKEKSGKVLVVGFVMRYMRALQKMQELIASGAIGKVVHAYANHEVPNGSRWYFHDWHARREFSTGLLLQKGSHDLDILNWLLGQKPVRTVAFGGLDVFGGNKEDDKVCQDCQDVETCPDFTNHHDHHPDMSKPIQCVYRKEVDVEDNHLVIVEYDQGARASYTECHFSPKARRTFCVIGSEGRIELNEDGLKIMKRFPKDTTSYDFEPISGGHGGGDTGLLLDFYEAVVNGKEPIAGGYAGRTSVALAIAAHKSMRENRIVELD